MTETRTAYRIGNLSLEVAPQSLRNDPQELASEWFELTETGLRERQPHKKPPLEAYIIQGKTLKKGFDLYRLATGDLLASLTKHYPNGEKSGLYEQMSALWGYSYHTMEDWARVSRRLPEAIRVKGLDYSHYRTLCVLGDDPQQQILWQERCLLGDDGRRWSVSKLEHFLDEAGHRQSQPIKPGNYTDKMWALQLEVDQKDEELERERQRRSEAEEQLQLLQNVPSTVTDSPPNTTPHVANAGYLAAQIRTLVSSLSVAEFLDAPEREFGRVASALQGILRELEG